jgi:hypothetical protein
MGNEGLRSLNASLPLATCRLSYPLLPRCIMSGQASERVYPEPL